LVIFRGISAALADAAKSRVGSDQRRLRVFVTGLLLCHFAKQTAETKYTVLHGPYTPIPNLCMKFHQFIIFIVSVGFGASAEAGTDPVVIF
jgi:hypothetical protein